MPKVLGMKHKTAFVFSALQRFLVAATSAGVALPALCGAELLSTHLSEPPAEERIELVALRSAPAQPAPARRLNLGRTGELLLDAAAVVAPRERAEKLRSLLGAHRTTAPRDTNGSELTVRPWMPTRNSIGVAVELSW